MSKAPSKELDALHGALASYFKAQLREGECTAALANVIRAFLKDNGVEQLPGGGTGERNEMDELADAAHEFLPFPGEVQDQEGE